MGSKGITGGPSGPSREGPGVRHKIVSDTKQMAKAVDKKKTSKGAVYMAFVAPSRPKNEKVAKGRIVGLAGPCFFSLLSSVLCPTLSWVQRQGLPGKARKARQIRPCMDPYFPNK